MGQPSSTGLQLNDIEGQDLFLPSREEVEIQLFSSGSSNDIWFRSTVDNALLPHEYTSTDSGYDLYSYDGRMRNTLGSFNPLTTSSSAPDVMSLYHASNFSAEPLDLVYTTTYYDLTGGKEGLNGLDGVLLFAQEFSGFRFAATAGEPLIISLKVKGNTETQNMNVYLISPSGELYNYAGVKTQYRTFVDEFIPIVPDETGTYTLYIRPNNANTDIILQKLRIYDSVSIFEIENGYTAKWTGTETQTLFFKYELDSNVDTPQMLDFDSEIFVNTSIPFVDQSFLLGSLDMVYFTPGIGPFGDSFPATVAQWHSNATYVAVTATPPNENNQFVAAKKVELGIRPGFDLDYAFWSEPFDVDVVELNTDVVFNDDNQPNTGVYFFNTTEDLIFGMNSSTVTGVVVSLDDPDVFFPISGIANNILEQPGDAPIFLEAGNYLVILSGTDGDEFRIHTFKPLTLDSGDSITLALKMNQPLFYELPVPYPIKDYFNVTYLERELRNASVDLDFRVYDEMMASRLTHTDTLEHYYDSGGTNLLSTNFTEFGDMINLDRQYNIHSGFMRVEVTDNTIWNPIGTLPLFSSFGNFTYKFKIDRLSFFDDLYTDPDDQFVRSTVLQAQAGTAILNGTKNQIVFVYDYTTSTTPSGYRLRLDSVNATFRIIAFVGWTTGGNHQYEWFDFNKNSNPTTINGVTHYIHNLEFGTNERLDFGFVVLINSPVNGTFNIFMEEFPVQVTPGVTLQTLNVVEYPYAVTDVYDGNGDESFLQENGALIAGGAVGVIVIGGVTYVIIRKRKGL